MRYSTLLLTTMFFMAGCTATEVKQPVCSGNLLSNCQPVIYFDEGKTDLKPESKENLNWVYKKMVHFPKKHLKVTGYTNSVGSANRNFDLSKARANVVKKYLVNKGINKDRIITEFQGEAKPVCHKDSCQAVNRRAELKIFSPNGGLEPINR